MSRWVCPFCNHPQVVTENNSHSVGGTLHIGASERNLYSYSTAILCLNEACSRASLFFAAHAYSRTTQADKGALIQSWRLWPESTSKPQPDYIPQVLQNDYKEACAIRDLSPKAAATLARRCLQGMIRDFCGISKGTLGGEIEALRTQLDNGLAPPGVSPESIDGIDAVRSIGNIGAHMEKDINVIVDVDADEAQVLIELIETLFDEWYVARHVRTERFARVRAIADDKKALVAGPKRLAIPAPD